MAEECEYFVYINSLEVLSVRLNKLFTTGEQGELLTTLLGT